MRDLTPRHIVEELDRYIVGQAEAKRAVAVAIRNRWRRQRLSEEMRREVAPKNILMIGPTGVGKTEIARRLAQLTGAPFVKVEASKYTEVGYYGRDVESIVRDLVENGIGMVREEERQRVEAEAQHRAEERLLDLLLPAPPSVDVGQEADGAERHRRNRERMRGMLKAGTLEENKVRMTVEQRALPVQVFSNLGMEQMDIDFQSMFEKILPRQSHERELPVREARRIVFDQEVESLIDREKVQQEAIRRSEESGIVFLDELDKICGPESAHGPDVSRQGVQRDLLPIVEGTTVQTRYGAVRSDHILFVAAGAFHRSSPSDLMPELQGRFPIRVELGDLSRDDFVRILTEPQNALTKQYAALIATEEVTLEFKPDAVEAMADIATRVNQHTQNIGARRLHTIMEKLVEELSFDAPQRRGERITIDAAYVNQRLAEITKDEDLSRFIL
ncbi:MAG: ATP-dependent protease ATPase subunit HslU [Pirellulales bacterium]